MALLVMWPTNIVFILPVVNAIDFVLLGIWSLSYGVWFNFEVDAKWCFTVNAKSDVSLFMPKVGFTVYARSDVPLYYGMRILYAYTVEMEWLIDASVNRWCGT